MRVKSSIDADSNGSLHIIMHRLTALWWSACIYMAGGKVSHAIATCKMLVVNYISIIRPLNVTICDCFYKLYTNSTHYGLILKYTQYC